MAKTTGGKPMHLAMVVRHPSSLKIEDPILGLQRPVSVDIPGLVGFIYVFDNVEAAREWGGGHVLTVETLAPIAIPDKPKGG